MQFLEDEIILLFGPKICFWKRYVDDIFPVKRDNLTEMSKTANPICTAS